MFEGSSSSRSHRSIPCPEGGHTIFTPTCLLEQNYLCDLLLAPDMDRFDLGLNGFDSDRDGYNKIAEALGKVNNIRYLRLNITSNDGVPVLFAVLPSVWSTATMISVSCTPDVIGFGDILSYIRNNTNLRVLHIHGCKFLSSIPSTLSVLYYSSDVKTKNNNNFEVEAVADVEVAFKHAVDVVNVQPDALFQYIRNQDAIQHFMRRPIRFGTVKSVKQEIRNNREMDIADPFFASYYSLHLDKQEQHRLSPATPPIHLHESNFCPSPTDLTGNAVDGALDAQRNMMSVDLFREGNNEDRVDALKEIKIAILDSGITLNHPDLEGVVADGKTFSDGSWQFDVRGHGTHCAGIIAGAKGGIATGARLYVGKVLSDYASSKTGGDLAGAIRWAIDQGVDIISMSIYMDYNEVVYNVIMEALIRGIIVVAAVGNEGNTNNNNIAFPASIEGVIRVGSHSALGNPSSFSAVGGVPIDVAAIGERVLSTSHSLHYDITDGTSLAAPCITGACALLLAYDRALNKKDYKIRNAHCMKYVLREYSKNNDQSIRMGHGKLHLDEAFQVSGYFQLTLRSIR